MLHNEARKLILEAYDKGVMTSFVRISGSI